MTDFCVGLAPEVSGVAKGGARGINCPGYHTLRGCKPTPLIADLEAFCGAQRPHMAFPGLRKPPGGHRKAHLVFGKNQRCVSNIWVLDTRCPGYATVEGQPFATRIP